MQQPNLFDQLLEGQSGYQIDHDRFWAVVEQIPPVPRGVSPTLSGLLARRYRRDGAVRQAQSRIARSYGVTPNRISQREILALWMLRALALFWLYAYRESPAELAALEFQLTRTSLAMRRGQPLSPHEREILNLIAGGRTARSRNRSDCAIRPSRCT